MFHDGTIYSHHKIRLSIDGFWWQVFLSFQWFSMVSLTLALFGNGIKMINVKKAVFVFCAAVGFAGAISSTAYALPTRETCEEAYTSCVVDGDEGQCNLVKRLCGVYGIHL